MACVPIKKRLKMLHTVVNTGIRLFMVMSSNDCWRNVYFLVSALCQKLPYAAILKLRFVVRCDSVRCIISLKINVINYKLSCLCKNPID